MVGKVRLVPDCREVAFGLHLLGGRYMTYTSETGASCHNVCISVTKNLRKKPTKKKTIRQMCHFLASDNKAH